MSTIQKDQASEIQNESAPMETPTVSIARLTFMTLLTLLVLAIGIGIIVIFKATY